MHKETANPSRANVTSRQDVLADKVQSTMVLAVGGCCVVKPKASSTWYTAVADIQAVTTELLPLSVGYTVVQGNQNRYI